MNLREMVMKNKELLKLLKENKKVIILPHIIPDGDTLGSAGALQHALNNFGNETIILIEDDIPSDLKFLELNNLYDIRNLKNEFTDFDMIITIDSSDIDRLGVRAKLLQYTDNILNIDHHKTNSEYGKFNYIDITASSCGEIIYDIIMDLNINIDKKIASLLYIAITTDTGSFKYSNTTPKTLRIAANLLEYGIDKDDINIQLYQNKPLNKMKLLIDTLNTLEFYFNNKLSIMYISLEMLKENNIDFSDSDGIIEHGRNIENVEIAVLLKEVNKKEIKVGLRSKGNYDVSEIAAFFGGGGHKNAAGCTIKASIEEAKNILIDRISNILR